MHEIIPLYSLTVNQLSRRSFLRTTSFVTAAGLLTACAPYRREDEGLRRLAIEAQADAATHPHLATLRHRHAELLERENNRRCGIRADGSSPRQCVFTSSDAEIAEARTRVPASRTEALVRSAHSVLAATDTVDRESWLVLSTVFGELVEQLSQDDHDAVTALLDVQPHITLRRSHKDVLLELATYEEAAIYSLGTAESFGARNRAHAYSQFKRDHSQNLAEITQVAKDSSLSLPAAAASYSFDGATEVHNDAAAAHLVSIVEKAGRAAWERLLTTTRYPECGRWAMLKLAETTLRVSKLVILGVH